MGHPKPKETYSQVSTISSLSPKSKPALHYTIATYLVDGATGRFLEPPKGKHALLESKLRASVSTDVLEKICTLDIGKTLRHFRWPLLSADQRPKLAEVYSNTAKDARASRVRYRVVQFLADGHLRELELGEVKEMKFTVWYYGRFIDPLEGPRYYRKTPLRWPFQAPPDVYVADEASSGSVRFIGPELAASAGRMATRRVRGTMRVTRPEDLVGCLRCLEAIEVVFEPEEAPEGIDKDTQRMKGELNISVDMGWGMEEECWARKVMDDAVKKKVRKGYL